jgi:putative transposase
VLDILIRPRRNAVAAKKFFGTLRTVRQYVPRVTVTDGVSSYRVAHRELMASVQHRRSKYPNNRAENSSPADPATRAGDETLHLDAARATVPVGVQRHLAALSAPSVGRCSRRPTTDR